MSLKPSFLLSWLILCLSAWQPHGWQPMPTEELYIVLSRIFSLFRVLWYLHVVIVKVITAATDYELKKLGLHIFFEKICVVENEKKTKYPVTLHFRTCKWDKCLRQSKHELTFVHFTLSAIHNLEVLICSAFLPINLRWNGYRLCQMKIMTAGMILRFSSSIAAQGWPPFQKRLRS